jgi:hypothetical protein
MLRVGCTVIVLLLLHHLLLLLQHLSSVFLVKICPKHEVTATLHFNVWRGCRGSPDHVAETCSGVRADGVQGHAGICLTVTADRTMTVTDMSTGGLCNALFGHSAEVRMRSHRLLTHTLRNAVIILPTLAPP